MSGVDDSPYLCEQALRFDGSGYFARPIPPALETSLTQVQLHRWLELQSIINRAKHGELGGAARLLELYRESHADPHPRDWAFEESAITVLAHIGGPEQFKAMRAEIEQPEIREADPRDLDARQLILDYCRAFHLWGRLDALPVILDQYLHARLREVNEVDMLPVYMSNMLDPAGEATMITEDPPEDMLEDYLNLVMNRYDALVGELGSEQLHVAFAEPLSATTLARRIVEAGGPYARFHLRSLRARFEPMTGIDCRGFFTIEPWTPLAAAAIAEEFLASNAGERFEPGVRYFFGHRLPA